MQGDFSRKTFDRHRQYARVLMQQGRVLLDADWNEQVAILIHNTRALAQAVIGPHGGSDDGFLIECDEAPKCDFRIGWGSYFVNGILCENHPPRLCSLAAQAPPAVTYLTQPDYPIREGDGAALKADKEYLVYLDVWERHLTHLQAGHIREVALAGPDTATRSKVVWQVKVAGGYKDFPEDAGCDELLEELVVSRHRKPRCLRARARVETPSDDPCIIPPLAQFRGPENQLYRVEIHAAGTSCDAKHRATFKWARDNASNVFSIRKLQGAVVTLDTFGPDDRRGLEQGDWVEICDDYSDLRALPRPLLQVEAIDSVSNHVVLAVPEGMSLPTFSETSTTHPLLRRWDQKSEAIAVREGDWIDLEDGVQVRFEPDGTYMVGDYWLIPARTATADVLWPTETGADGERRPKAVPPHGIEHAFAPLARIAVDSGGTVICDLACRCGFEPLCRHPHEDSVDRDAMLETLEPLPPLRFGESPNAGLEAVRAVLHEEGDRVREALVQHPGALLDLRALAPAEEKREAARLVAIVRDHYLLNEVDFRRIRSSILLGQGPYQVERAIVRPEPLETADGSGVKLQTVDGIGPAFAQRLEKANIRDVKALLQFDPDRLAEILSPPGRTVPRERARDILDQAQALLARR